MYMSFSLFANYQNWANVGGTSINCKIIFFLLCQNSFKINITGKPKGLYAYSSDVMWELSRCIYTLIVYNKTGKVAMFTADAWFLSITTSVLTLWYLRTMHRRWTLIRHITKGITVITQLRISFLQSISNESANMKITRSNIIVI